MPHSSHVRSLRPIIAGRYRDAFKCLNGDSCFDTRIVLFDLPGDLSQHLLFEITEGEDRALKPGSCATVR